MTWYNDIKGHTIVKHGADYSKKREYRIKLELTNKGFNIVPISQKKEGERKEIKQQLPFKYLFKVWINNYRGKVFYNIRSNDDEYNFMCFPLFMLINQGSKTINKIVIGKALDEYSRIIYRHNYYSSEPINYRNELVNLLALIDYPEKAKEDIIKTIFQFDEKGNIEIKRMKQKEKSIKMIKEFVQKEKVKLPKQTKGYFHEVFGYSNILEEYSNTMPEGIELSPLMLFWIKYNFQNYHGMLFEFLSDGTKHINMAYVGDFIHKISFIPKMYKRIEKIEREILKDDLVDYFEREILEGQINYTLLNQIFNDIEYYDNTPFDYSMDIYNKILFPYYSRYSLSMTNVTKTKILYYLYKRGLVHKDYIKPYIMDFIALYLIGAEDVEKTLNEMKEIKKEGKINYDLETISGMYIDDFIIKTKFYDTYSKYVGLNESNKRGSLEEFMKITLKSDFFKIPLIHVIDENHDKQEEIKKYLKEWE